MNAKTNGKVMLQYKNRRTQLIKTSRPVSEEMAKEALRYAPNCIKPICIFRIKLKT